MRLFEILLEENQNRKFLISVWVDYAAHSGDLPPNKFAVRAKWLEEKLNEIAKTNGLYETGSGGYVGSAGGSRDISFSSNPADLDDTLYTAQMTDTHLRRFKKEVDSVVAKMGMNSSLEFDYSITLWLQHSGNKQLVLGYMPEIHSLISKRVRVEQLIDKASEDLMEAKSKKSVEVKSPPPRNFVAKNAKTSGAGSHTTKKFTRKEKHKTTPDKS